MQRVTFNIGNSVADNSQFQYTIQFGSINPATTINYNYYTGSVLLYKPNIQVDITNVIYNIIRTNYDAELKLSQLNNTNISLNTMSNIDSVDNSNSIYSIVNISVYNIDSSGNKNYLIYSKIINTSEYITNFIPDLLFDETSKLQQNLNIPLGNSISTKSVIPIFQSIGANGITYQRKSGSSISNITVANSSSTDPYNMSSVNIYETGTSISIPTAYDTNVSNRLYGYVELFFTCKYRYYIYYRNKIGGIDLIGCNGKTSFGANKDLSNLFPNYDYTKYRDVVINTKTDSVKWTLTTEPIDIERNKYIDNLLQSGLVWVLDTERSNGIINYQLEDRYYADYGYPANIVSSSIEQKNSRDGIITYNIELDSSINIPINY